MIIKEISPNKKDYLTRDLKKDYNNKNFNFKNFYKTYKDFEKDTIEHLKINKKYNLLDYEIIGGVKKWNE